MRIIGMIPARLDSSRLDKKALIDIEGLPMVVHTCKRAELANVLDEVFLVTDDITIRDVGRAYNINCIMTGNHISSSDRLAEACKKTDCDIVVNIQGDEPLVNPDHINKVLEPFFNDQSVKIAVGVTPFTKANSISDIKVVKDLNGHILYMSRNDIPNYYKNVSKEMYKMCSIVPFRKKLLLDFNSWDETPLELAEDNHFLRILEHGIKINTVMIDNAAISVDTASDLEDVRKLMVEDKIKYNYMSN
jgi:3-deoxy-manno-octulosonate cytidylyltransferase (CMP-KDO synthetase)